MAGKTPTAQIRSCVCIWLSLRSPHLPLQSYCPVWQVEAINALEETFEKRLGERPGCASGLGFRVYKALGTVQLYEASSFALEFFDIPEFAVPKKRNLNGHLTAMERSQFARSIRELGPIWIRARHGKRSLLLEKP